MYPLHPAIPAGRAKPDGPDNPHTQTLLPFQNKSLSCQMVSLKDAGGGLCENLERVFQGSDALAIYANLLHGNLYRTASQSLI